MKARTWNLYFRFVPNYLTIHSRLLTIEKKKEGVGRRERAKENVRRGTEGESARLSKAGGGGGGYQHEF